jgi:hypothetical protein
MTLMDRRRAIRFEFVEGQWGSLRALEPLRLRNVGQEGLLIESTTPLAIGSTHEIRLAHRAITAQCRVAVRHQSPVPGAANGQPYLIGLEFINLDDQTKALVAQVLAEPANRPSPNEA